MLGMLGDNKKIASMIISGTGKMDGKEYTENYGEGKEDSEMDMMNPVEMMAKELINAIHAKDAKKTAEIFCYILEVKSKSGVEIEIKA